MEQPSPVTAWIEIPSSWGDPPRRFVFGRPLETWQATRIDDVFTAVERVSLAQRSGCHVVGFLSYESAPAFDPVMVTPPTGDLPFAWFAAFDSPLLEAPTSVHARPQTPYPSFLTEEAAYVSAVRRALAHIRAGDIYQVNYTVRAALEIADPYALFQSLLAAAPMPHASYLDTGQVQLVSLSPELFLRRRANILESRPMKGTARREPSWLADEAARIALSRDEKNRAENVMIVDLVRNDLGRICRMGSVSVPELWRSDRFPTVHQMNSLVRGELREGVSLFEIFAALFPPGSVTGAPKIRAMEIIADLEPQPRGTYCGTIGLFFPDGDFECNVAIRTVETHASPSALKSSILGLGSGIVADSDPETEWHETQLKGKFVTLQPRDFILYETIRFDQVKPEVDGQANESGRASPHLPRPSSYQDLHSHLRRLRQSCLYFGKSFPLREIIRHLRELKSELGNSPARVKLDLQITSGTPDSTLFLIKTHVIRENLSWPADGMKVMLSGLRLDPEDFRLYHKTNLRPEKYEELEKARALGASEVLFLNTRNELCEGALSNLVLKIDGEWLTPALSCGLLPGTWREKQLACGRLREAILKLEDLYRAEEIRMGNAVRGETRVIEIIPSDSNSR